MVSALRVGVLGNAKIARTKVIPALVDSPWVQVVALASRDQAAAQASADQLGIAKAYGSYDALLADPDIDAIYNPLPNDLHVPWSLRSLEAGKHVLCEKPLGLNTADVQRLIAAAAAKPGCQVMEAFMYRFHPQWQRLRADVTAGRIGKIRSAHAHFNYNNHEVDNIRNNPAAGGGGLMDIGCYCISVLRWFFGEPVQVMGRAAWHPEYGVDELFTGLLIFADGAQASFTCGTKTELSQGLSLHGTHGSLTVARPFFPVEPEPNLAQFSLNGAISVEEFAPTNQYCAMFDAFAQACLHNTQVPTPLTDALANMQVIDALMASERLGQPVALPQ